MSKFGNFVGRYVRYTPFKQYWAEEEESLNFWDIVITSAAVLTGVLVGAVFF